MNSIEKIKGSSHFLYTLSAVCQALYYRWEYNDEPDRHGAVLKLIIL